MDPSSPLPSQPGSALPGNWGAPRKASARQGVRRNIPRVTGASHLFTANYVGNGVEGLLKEGGTKRREAVSKADVASAVATSLTIHATGVVSLALTPLILPEEVDLASRKHASYRAPGQ